MASLWSGSISFGLVSIPVRLEVSQRSQNISFNLLHEKCLTRIQQRTYCPSCEEYLERSDLVKGYQYEKDNYVVITPEDLESAEAGASRNIDVVAFVDETQLKPVHLNKTYYLVPEAGAEKAYVLLQKGMKETGKVAITRFVMRGKEYIGAVSFEPPGLRLHVLFHKGEFTHLSEVLQLPEVEVQEKELDLAVQIIENLSEEFSEDLLEDQHRERLLEVIRRRIEGEQVVVAESKEPAKVVDLMEALKKSLEVSQKKPASEGAAEKRSAGATQRRRA